MTRFRQFAHLALALGVGAALTGTATAAGISIRGLAADQLRLAKIQYAIGTANRAACAQPEVMTGLVVHDLTQYPQENRRAIANAFSLRGGYGILGVVPGSGASLAGLRVDDEIVGIGNRVLDAGDWADHAPRSYNRMSALDQLFQQELGGRPIDLTIRRAGRVVRMKLASDKGCGGQIALEQSSSLNAWSDGKSVVVSSAIVNFAKSDDEIAFVIAHEMAHNILDHPAQLKTVSRGLLALFGFGSARVRRAEVAADSFAIGLMSNGGYAPTGALAFLKEAARKMWWANLSIDHPGFGRRLAVVSEAISSNANGQAQARTQSDPQIALGEVNGPATQAARTLAIAMR